MSNVRLLVDKDARDAIERCARWARILRAVERAHLLCNDEEIESLLGQVDPTQVKLDAGAAQQLVVLYDHYTREAEPVA